MKILFTSAMTNSNEYQEAYSFMQRLGQYGEVLITPPGSDYKGGKIGPVVPHGELFKLDEERIKSAQVVVIAGCTTQDTRVGFQYGLAYSLGKPILALHNENRGNLPGIIAGNPSPRLQVRNYQTLEQALDHIDEFCTNMQQQIELTNEVYKY